MTLPAVELAAITGAATIAVAPAALGLRRWLRKRSVIPLIRASLEENAVLAACLASAAGTLALADGAALVAGTDFAPVLLGFAAPLPLGAAPWIAGEVLSGHSRRAGLALCASVAAACAASWASFAICWPDAAPALTPAIAAIQFAAATTAALCAGRVYLAVRGEPPKAA